MQAKICAAMVGMLMGAGSLQAATIQNVALGKPVSLMTGTTSGAALNTITDGVFRPEGTQWQSGTVWWNGTDEMFEIDFGGAVTLTHAIVQGDNNDTYRLTYRDVGTNTWLTLWDVGSAAGAGMRTRPGASNQGLWQTIGPVVTDAVRFQATGGDNSYSVSEIQLGSTVAAVPMPAAASAGAALLGALAIKRRRRTD